MLTPFSGSNAPKSRTQRVIVVGRAKKDANPIGRHGRYWRAAPKPLPVWVRCLVLLYHTRAPIEMVVHDHACVEWLCCQESNNLVCDLLVEV
jgi:hypothetical protein